MVGSNEVAVLVWQQQREVRNHDFMRLFFILAFVQFLLPTAVEHFYGEHKNFEINA